MINQQELVAALDTFFNVAAFDERDARESLPPGYDSVIQRYAAPGFWEGPWNGLMLDNAPQVDRVYLTVFPSQDALDTIIAREVQRNAPGALIFCHHLGDYQESGPGSVYIPEPQLEELREHHISFYVCHAPLDCHPEISTSTALAEALKLKDTVRFGPYHGGLCGVYGTMPPAAFSDFARRVAEACGLPHLLYGSIRNDGLPIQQVGVIAGLGGTPDYIREAINLGCDTFVTGEWWLFGPGEWRARHRERIREFLGNARINLIGTSHYASEALVLRGPMAAWFREHLPGLEAVFIGQDDPWR